LLELLWGAPPLERAAELPDWVAERNRVGWRAELYSLRLERSLLGPKRVLHISRDAGDQFGYDIEAIEAEGSRLIEVKGSRSAVLSFTLSAQELDVARARAGRYEIQFWGEIELGAQPAEEYGKLRSRGYPIVIHNPAEVIEQQDWSVEARSWLVRRL
jgi:hypothetical protein